MKTYKLVLALLLALALGFCISWVLYYEEASECPDCICECNPTVDYITESTTYHNQPAEDYKEKHIEEYNITETDRLTAREKLDIVLERFN